MPHIPRTSPTTGIPQELMRPAGGEHSALPLPDKTEKEKPKRKKLGLSKLNLRTYEPDEEQLLKTLLGKEPDVDPYTGVLVSPTNNTGNPTTNGNNGQPVSRHPILPMLSRLEDPHAHRPPPGFAG